MKGSKKRLLSLLLAITMVLSLLPMGVAARGESGGEISRLQVNSLTEPLGIDTTPVFRWRLDMDGYGKAQSAYQIIVASTAEQAAAHEGDLWDSGKVAGSDNFDVRYAGAALTSRTPYYWAVQVWDEAGASLGWSEVETFETGVLHEDEWTARWITSKQGGELGMVDLKLSGANWIWSRYGAAQDGVPGETMYFRGSFTVNAEKAVREAYLGFTTDDYGSFYLNGRKAGEVFNKPNGWQGGSLTEITDLVQNGVNTVAADVTNGERGYAGFIAKIEVRYTDGTTDTMVTDGSWKLTKTPADGWQNEGFDDSAWETPDQVLGYGSAPWGNSVSLNLKKEDGESYSAPMLRKSFTIDREVRRARAYVSGLGLFEMKINGQLPDDSVLNPAHTQYEDTVNYRVFDVTELLRQGGNAITAEVGNSFYNCIINTWSWPDAVWRDYPKFMMELEVEYTDGTGETLVTDESWKSWSQGPVTANDIYVGETYDARREVPGWEAPDFDDSAMDAAVLAEAPAGTLKFEAMEPMRRVKTFVPEVIDKGEGTFVMKNPEMATGWAKIAFDAPAGTEITITYGEQLAGGYLSKVGLEGHIIQCDTYICKGVPGETYEPKYSYKGYEYIQVDGYPGVLTADDVECYLITNDVNVISTFETSNDMVNQLHAIMQRTMRNNMQGKPTDTPVWEKNGWTGDYNVSLRSFNYNFDAAAFHQKFQGDLRDSATDRGVVPDISPTANWGIENSPVWNTAYINSLYENWKSNGQFTAIEDHYEAMRKQTIAYIEDIGNNGWVWHDWYLSDWVAPDGDASASEGSGICGTAYIYVALNRMAEIADELGKTADAAQYRDAAGKIYTAFNTKFYNDAKGYYETTVWSDAGGLRTRYRQTSNLVPLAFGLCPEEHRQSVLASLLDHITNVKGTHLDTGMVGTELLLPVLSEQGNADLAYALLTQTTYPSWGYWLEQGSSSTWEGYSTACRSRNHYFLGTYEEWLYAYLAGIRDFSNGYETVTIDPYVNGELTFVNCAIDTVRGTVQSNWRVDESITMDVAVPTGTTAKIYLPAAAAEGVTVNGKALADQAGITGVTTENGKVAVTAGSGSYCFVMRADGVAVSKSALRKAVGEAKGLKEENYADGIWARLTEVLARAEAMLSDGSVKQAEISAMAAELEAVVEEAEAHRMGNLALHKHVTVSSTVDASGWHQNGLTDGVTKAASLDAQVQGWTSNNLLEEDHEEWAMVDLGRTYQIARADLYAAGQKGMVGSVSYGFPKDFVIEVSTDGKEWTAVASEQDYAPPAVEVEGVTPVRSFSFAEIGARYVRVRGTSLNRLVHDGGLYRMQLSELEIYNNLADRSVLKSLIAQAEKLDFTVYPPAAVEEFRAVLAKAKELLRNDEATQAEMDAMEAELTAAWDVLALSIPQNMAKGKPVSVSSSLDAQVGTGWHQLNLTDGDRKNQNQWSQYGGWTSNNTIDVNHEEWAMVDLTTVEKVNKIRLAPAGYIPNAGTTIYGFPKDMVIEVSVDGRTWETAYAVNDYPTLTVTTTGEVPMQTFDFTTAEARYIRVCAKSLHALANDGNTYRMQLAEIEAYYYPESSSALAAAVDALIDAIGIVHETGGEAIDAARKAYEALDDKAKALVTKLDVLEAAEKDFKAMTTDVVLILTAPETINAFDEAAVFTLSGKEMTSLANVILTFDVSEEYLTEPVATGEGGWVVAAQSYAKGKLTVVAFHVAGVSGEGDIVKLTMKPCQKAGTASVALTDASLAAYISGDEIYVGADWSGAAAQVEVSYSIYDVNHDGVVDQLDMTRAQRFYGHYVADCDVNGDGEINVTDLILIWNNFDK